MASDSKPTDPTPLQQVREKIEQLIKTWRSRAVAASVGPRCVKCGQVEDSPLAYHILTGKEDFGHAEGLAHYFEAASLPAAGVEGEPTERPKGERLMLNAYGRECYEAGQQSALTEALRQIEALPRYGWDDALVSREGVLAILRPVRNDVLPKNPSPLPRVTGRRDR